MADNAAASSAWSAAKAAPSGGKVALAGLFPDEICEALSAARACCCAASARSWRSRSAPRNGCWPIRTCSSQTGLVSPARVFFPPTG